MELGQSIRRQRLVLRRHKPGQLFLCFPLLQLEAVDHISLDPTLLQPACQPEPVSTGLEGNADTLDNLPSRPCFLAPPGEQIQQRLRLRRQLLLRIARPTGYKTTDKPTGTAHLDCRDKRAILLKGDEGSAEVVELRHLGLSYRLGLKNPIDRASSLAAAAP